LGGKKVEKSEWALSEKGAKKDKAKKGGWTRSKIQSFRVIKK